MYDRYYSGHIRYFDSPYPSRAGPGKHRCQKGRRRRRRRRRRDQVVGRRSLRSYPRIDQYCGGNGRVRGQLGRQRASQQLARLRAMVVATVVSTEDVHRYHVLSLSHDIRDFRWMRRILLQWIWTYGLSRFIVLEYIISTRNLLNYGMEGVYRDEN